MKICYSNDIGTRISPIQLFIDPVHSKPLRRGKTIVHHHLNVTAVIDRCALNFLGEFISPVDKTRIKVVIYSYNTPLVWNNCFVVSRAKLDTTYIS